MAILAPAELQQRKIDYVIITAPRFLAEIQAKLQAEFNVGVDLLDADVGVATQICRLH